MYLNDGSVLLDGYLAKVQTTGISAYLPGEGIRKADMRAIIEFCTFPCMGHMGDLFFFQ